uniref:Pectinesterase inhibitor domain-containing protein n=1 Tax=Kalanchoe fedtschenkoi TaxID=63787 RepID=A0A7N0T107_KALFE
MKFTSVAATLVNQFPIAIDVPDSSACQGPNTDCVSSFGDAMEQMRGSLKQMKEIETAGRTSGGESMSAALTNQDTCTDGFEEVDEGPLKAKVGRRVGLAKKLTSNALAHAGIGEKG